MPAKLSIADLAAAIKRREPRLASVPDADLVRKVLERRPEMTSMIETSEPRKPMGSLYERIGGRLREDFNLPKQARGAAEGISEAIRDIKERGLAPAGVNRWPEIWQTLSKTYKDPANVIGDIVAAVTMGQSGGEPTRLARPTVPPEGAYGMPPAQARALPLEANLLETMIKARAKEMAAKYPVPQWQRIQDPFAAPARSQPTAFTPEATDWHNTALNQAKQKLGPGADIGSVLQLAAKIQQAGK